MSQNDFPGRVRAERKRRGMTQKQLADEANVALRTVQMFEGRKSPGTPANRHAIGDALGLDENGNNTAGETPEWPRHVEVFRDMIGAYLLTFPEDEQIRIIHDVTRQIFEARR